MPSVSLFEQVQPGLEDAVGEPGRIAELAVARADLEVLRLELEHDGAPGEAGFLQPRRDLFRQRAQHRHEVGAGGEVGVEGGLGGDALGVLVGVHHAHVLAARQVVEPVAHRAVAPHQLALLHALQLADRADAVALRAWRRRPCRRPRSASPAARPGSPAPPPRRSPRNRAASSGRTRPWPGTCSRRARPKR